MEINNIILSLIKEDLRSSKLVLGLSELGLDAGQYHTELYDLVFDLMEIEVQNDSLLDFYFEQLERAKEIPDLEENLPALAAMAEDIYRQLLEQKKLRDH
jgi:hypothetical protein